MWLPMLMTPLLSPTELTYSFKQYRKKASDVFEWFSKNYLNENPDKSKEETSIKNWKLHHKKYYIILHKKRLGVIIDNKPKIM